MPFFQRGSQYSSSPAERLAIFESIPLDGLALCVGHLHAGLMPRLQVKA